MSLLVFGCSSENAGGRNSGASGSSASSAGGANAGGTPSTGGSTSTHGGNGDPPGTSGDAPGSSGANSTTSGGKAANGGNASAAGGTASGGSSAGGTGMGGAATGGASGGSAPAGGSVDGEFGDPNAASGTTNYGVPKGPAPDDLTQSRCASPRREETLHTTVTTAAGSVELHLWIPADTCFVRCGFAYFSNSDDGSLVTAADLKYIAARHACGVWSLGIHYPSGAKWHRPALDGTGAALVDGFTALAAQSGRPELRYLPLAATGMSIDATFITNLALMMPERVIAVAPLHGGGLMESDLSPEAENVVWAFLTGSADGVLSPAAALANLKYLRARGAAVAVAVQPNIGHDPGQFRGLAFPFLDAAISYRLPKVSPTNAPVPLTKLEDRCWLGNNDSRAVFRAAEYPEDKALASWLPSEFVARRWQSYWKGELPKVYAP